LGGQTEAVRIVSVADVLRELARDPASLLVRRWNWKAALFGAVFRALIFFAANLAAGWRAALAAMLVELLYRGFSAGLLGALAQAFREAQPTWLATCTVMVLLPLISHSLEFAIHFWRGTPRLITSVVSSVIFTVLSGLFNLYAMRRNAFIVGSGGGSFGSDLRALPRLLCGFLACGPMALWRLFQRWPQAHRAEEQETGISPNV
jgi:hypothetical protein